VQGGIKMSLPTCSLGESFAATARVRAQRSRVRLGDKGGEQDCKGDLFVEVGALGSEGGGGKIGEAETGNGSGVGGVGDEEFPPVAGELTQREVMIDDS